MERVARAYDIEEYDVYVLSNAIFANAVENGEKIDTKLKSCPDPPFISGALWASTSFHARLSRAKSR